MPAFHPTRLILSDRRHRAKIPNVIFLLTDNELSFFQLPYRKVMCMEKHTPTYAGSRFSDFLHREGSATMTLIPNKDHSFHCRFSGKQLSDLCVYIRRHSLPSLNIYAVPITAVHFGAEVFGHVPYFCIFSPRWIIEWPGGQQILPAISGAEFSAIRETCPRSLLDSFPPLIICDANGEPSLIPSTEAFQGVWSNLFYCV